MPNVFISYRREDAAMTATYLAGSLRTRFGKDSVFLDVDNIPPGVDFRGHLDQAVAQCHVCIVVIGSDWLVAEDNTRRLDSEADFVRIEIESALKRNIPVIPLLVGNQRMPDAAELPESLRPLAFRNASKLRSGPDMQSDLERLLSAISKLPDTEASENPKGSDSATPAGESGTADRDIDEILRCLVEHLAGRSGAAEAPEQLEPAIQSGLADVDQAIASIERQSTWSTEDIQRLTTIAIGHGGGIYNHPSGKGQVACGRIYHRAAAGVVGLMWNQVRDSEGPLAGLKLAVFWLHRIIEAVPMITRENGDDTAWELRFAFDSIGQLSLFNEIAVVLYGAAQEEDAPMHDILAEACVGNSFGASYAHVEAYLLQHAAQLLSDLSSDDILVDRHLKPFLQRVDEALKQHARITRESRLEVRQTFAELIQEIAEAMESGPGSDGIWGWFGRK